MSKNDGRVDFFRKLDLDKHDKQLLYFFRDIKTEMINEQNDDYTSGKRYTEQNPV